MKIVRYWLEKLFNCTFSVAIFNYFIFNPQVIKLLFNEEEINKLKFNTQISHLNYYNYNNENFLQFNSDYLVISIRLVIFDLNETNIDILFNLLLNERERIPEVTFRNYIEPNICNLILNVS
uniref:Uncharacterized protein n=1 Tax=Meloidogyne hapla TaxID=6305 RepID=A0A1I8BCN3_MELHA